MSYAPLVVFVYNRKDHAQKCLENLANNHHAADSDLYIFSDGAKSEKGLPKVHEVRDYLESVKDTLGFKSVNITYAEKNKGLAKSVISGVTEVINKYGKVIVTEDDLVTHVNYIDYMNEALDFYQNDEHIYSISGYCLPQLQRETDDVYFTHRGSSWGWATWADRWNKIDWSMDHFLKNKWNPIMRYKLAKAGLDLYIMMKNQHKGVIDSWAVRWVYHQTQHDLMTVYPSHTLLHNVGFDGSGTHQQEMGNETYDNLDAVKYKLVPYVYDKQMAMKFRNEYTWPVSDFIVYKTKELLGVKK